MDDRILKFADSRQFIGRIARSGENNTRSLAFDCSSALAEYPTAQIVAVIQRPQGDPYTVTPDTDGTIRRITLTSYDLEFNGHLQIELRVIDGNKILKSAIYSARVDDSIRGEADAPGQPVRDVLDRLDVEIKQAQAVVDDIRQKLENGEFNGSDATVTAENIQSALGYTPVTPSDLAAKQNVLTDADKQSIAKIGMTTGAAWTDAEQKAARERIGVSAEFELIEEITLSEDVMNVAREAFPDGTPYNLRSLIIVVDSTNVENRSDVGGWVRLNAKLPYTEWTYIAFGDFITTNDSFSCFVHRVLSDGSVDSYFARTPDATPTSYTSDRMYIPSNVIRFGMHINDFLLYSIKSAIPANTKIAIYGVRA